jgi:hypothetical protein
MEQDRKNEESPPAPAPAAVDDDESTVLVVGDDGVIDEPADADRPDFNDDLDPADAP